MVVSVTMASQQSTQSPQTPPPLRRMDAESRVKLESRFGPVRHKAKMDTRFTQVGHLYPYISAKDLRDYRLFLKDITPVLRHARDKRATIVQCRTNQEPFELLQVTFVGRVDMPEFVTKLVYEIESTAEEFLVEDRMVERKVAVGDVAVHKLFLSIPLKGADEAVLEDKTWVEKIRYQFPMDIDDMLIFSRNRLHMHVYLRIVRTRL